MGSPFVATNLYDMATIAHQNEIAYQHRFGSKGFGKPPEKPQRESITDVANNQINEAVNAVKEAQEL